MFGVTFLGHQGWLFQTDSTSLLVDPLLTDRFGHGGVVGDVFPPRTLKLDQLPRLDAVLVTHEHEDHFDIPSLHLLDRGVPLLLSARSSIAARTIAREMGFAVDLVSPGNERRVGDLVLHLFGPDHLAAINGDEWDVLQFLIADARGDGSFFSTVDTACTPQTRARLRTLAPAPGLLCHTNNSTNWSFRRAGMVLEAEPPLDTLGLAGEVLREHARMRFAWGNPTATLICGTGFSFSGSRRWMNQNVFFADSDRIAAALALVTHEPVIAPIPGQTIVMNRGAIVALDGTSAFVQARPEHEWPSRTFVGDVELVDEYDPACGRMELTDVETRELTSRLRELAAYLYARNEFRALYSLPGPVDRRSTLVLVLLADHERDACAFEWDIQGCEFVQVEVDDPVASYVAGIEMWGTDLLALFRGSFGPSAVAFGRARTWCSIPAQLTSQLFGLWEFFHPLSRPTEYLELYRSLFSAVRQQQRAVPSGIVIGE